LRDDIVDALVGGRPTEAGVSSGTFAAQLRSASESAGFVTGTRITRELVLAVRRFQRSRETCSGITSVNPLPLFCGEAQQCRHCSLT
jgi:hypothetical protein